MIMFGPSLKSVPGCLVSIVPMLIGVPVAFTPGFEPHFEVLVEPPLDDVLDPPPPLAAALLLLLELLPQPASASRPSAAASAIQTRMRGMPEYVLTDVLLSSKGMNLPLVGPRCARY
jgi:hypothetical protein